MASLLARNCLLTSVFRGSSVIAIRSSSTVSERKIQLGGIYPPLTTPFLEDESIAYDQLAANLARYSRIKFAGYVVLGSNGEYPFMDREEKIQLVKFVKDYIKGSGKPLIAGSGCECNLNVLLPLLHSY